MDARKDCVIRWKSGISPNCPAALSLAHVRLSIPIHEVMLNGFLLLRSNDVTAIQPELRTLGEVCFEIHSSASSGAIGNHPEISALTRPWSSSSMTTAVDKVFSAKAPAWGMYPFFANACT